MKYQPELGMWGNVNRALTELTKTNSKVRDTQGEVQRVDSRVASAEEVNNITFVALAETSVLDDDTAARHAEVFPLWAVGVEYKIEKGKHPMRVDPLTGKLYRLNDGQAHTSVEGWNPSLTPAMWTVVDVTHAGTTDDPIPADRGMEFVYGLYYTDPEDGKLYLCKRQGEPEGGKVVLQFLPHELVGNYFEEVTA